MTDPKPELVTKPLNLTDEEIDYLWGMIAEEIGDPEVWERGDNQTVESIHSKLHSLKGADDRE